MSALPRGVQKKIKQAEELHRKVYEEPKEEAGEKAEQQETEESKVEEENTDLSAGTEEQQTEETVRLIESTEENPKTDDTWEAKWRTLNGKYKAEVPRLHRQVKQLQGEITGLRDLLANLDSLKKEPEKPAPEQTVSQENLLKPDEIEDYGADLIDVMRRAGQEGVNPVIQSLRNEIDVLKRQLGGVSQTVAMSSRDKVFNLLSSKIPNWEELNNDPGFLEWLDQIDPYSGISRQQMLSNAFEKNDGLRVVTFFQGYLNENDAMQTAQPAAAPQRTPQKKLDDLVAPGRPKAPVAAAQEGKRTWTQAQIAAFYRDVTDGKYRNNPDKKRALEQDIIAAPLEGRLVL